MVVVVHSRCSWRREQDRFVLVLLARRVVQLEEPQMDRPLGLLVAEQMDPLRVAQRHLERLVVLVLQRDLRQRGVVVEHRQAYQRETQIQEWKLGYWEWQSRDRWEPRPLRESVVVGHRQVVLVVAEEELQMDWQLLHQMHRMGWQLIGRMQVVLVVDHRLVVLVVDHRLVVPVVDRRLVAEPQKDRQEHHKLVQERVAGR
jgi:hypothetical protein